MFKNVIKNVKKELKKVEKVEKKLKICCKLLNVVKNEIFDQSPIKTLKTIKGLIKVLSKHLKHSNV